MISGRLLIPELLDNLPQEDPLAVGSRRDLARINSLMGHARLISNALRPSGISRILEIGAGDGQLALRVAQVLGTERSRAKLTLLDRQPLVTQTRINEFQVAGWECEPIAMDVFEFLERPHAESFDAIIANLFLHHFEGDRLRQLLRLCAERCNLFLACEPERSTIALTGSRLIWVLGGNSVTKHDAQVSVRAGFRNEEISAMWPKEEGWTLSERSVLPFSHIFHAERTR